jgi:hypothetical protein
MIVATINVDTTFSSSMIMAAPNIVSSEQDVAFDLNSRSNDTNVRFDLVTDDMTSGLVAEAPNVECWNPKKGLRFKALARGEAIRDLSIEELAELESLTRLRRFEKNPRTADEILWHRRQQKLTQSLVQALEKYVDFHETSNSS